MYERCGVPMSEDILTAIAARAPAERAAAEQIIEEMEEEGRRTLTLMPGAADLVRFLHDHGVPTALVTRNTRATVQTLTTRLAESGVVGEAELFHPAISRDEKGVPAKPDPAAMRVVAEAWGVKDEATNGLLMIGDSPSNDIAFGKAAGARTLLLDTGRRHTEGGSTGGANHVVTELGDVPFLLMAFYTLPGLTEQARSALNERVPPLVKYGRPEPKGEVAIAAASGDVAALRALHAAGHLKEASEAVAAATSLASPQQSDPNTWAENSPLIWAADAGHCEAVQYLLELEQAEGVPVHLNHRGFLGATAVCRACRYGHLDVLRLLLQQPGIDINQPNVNEQSPLHFAAFKKHPDAVQVMLEAGADTTVLDRKGRTPAEDTSVDAIREAIYTARRASIERTR